MKGYGDVAVEDSGSFSIAPKSGEIAGEPRLEGLLSASSPALQGLTGQEPVLS